MDMLHTRYACPFPYLDQVIASGSFVEFVAAFLHKVYEDADNKATWEYFLHRVYDKSFLEFKEDLKIDAEHRCMTENDKEAAVKHSIRILENFSPEEVTELGAV